MLVLRGNNESTGEARITGKGIKEGQDAWADPRLPGIYVVRGTVGRSFCAFIRGNVLEATTCVVSGYCLLDQSEEPRVKELNWLLEKKNAQEYNIFLYTSPS